MLNVNQDKEKKFANMRHLDILKDQKLSIVKDSFIEKHINPYLIFLFLGLKEKIVRSFEVSPDGSFLLINGVAGYFHLLSMKVKHY